jgi:hemolysin activation/secretion protein
MPGRRQYQRIAAPVLGATAALIMGCPADAQGVAPSRVTPDTVRPSTAERFEPPLDLPEPETREVPLSQLSVQAGRLQIEGAFPEMHRATATFRAELENRRLTVGQIFAMARSLEEVYAEAGYVLARVIVPPQILTGYGVLRFIVIDGFIEAADATGLPDRVRAAVLERVEVLIDRRHVTLPEIERALLVAGDIAGLRLKSALARGREEGGSLLILGGTHKLLSGTLGLDNALPSALGRWSQTASASLNSAAGLGEQLYVSAAFGQPLSEMPDLTSPLRLFGGGVVLPVGANGWTVNAEYTRSLTNPLIVNDEIAQAGLFERVAVRTSYPLVRARSETLLIDGAVEHIYQTLELPDFATGLSEDRYIALRAGGVLDKILPWGASLRLALHFSHGLGGRGLAEAVSTGIPLSRQDAGPVFTKANAEARFVQALPDTLRLEITAKGQSSFADALLRPEQFALDGLDVVAARPDHSLTVDEGFALRAELSCVVPAGEGARRVTLMPYVFAAGGWGRLNAPTILEAGSTRAASVGVGLRGTGELTEEGHEASFGIELARQYSSDEQDPEGWRANISAAIRF